MGGEGLRVGVKEADSFPSTSFMLEFPFLPQAGAGHFVQIPVNTHSHPSAEIS